MQLFIYIDETDIDSGERQQKLGPVVDALGAWVAEQGEGVALIDEPGSEFDPEPRLGLELRVKRKSDLKEPLAALYSLGRSHKLEWMLGIIKPTGEREPVCYFGHEEGRPDPFEIGNYVGL